MVLGITRRALERIGNGSKPTITCRASTANRPTWVWLTSPWGESPQPQAGALQGQVQPEEAGQGGRQAGPGKSAETAAGLA